MAKRRRSEIKDVLEYAGPEVVIDMVLELEGANDRLRRILTRADTRHAEIVKERDAAIGRAAVAEARCGQIPVWRGIVEDLAAALSERDVWAIRDHARAVLASVPAYGPSRETRDAGAVPDEDGGARDENNGSKEGA